MKFRKWLVLAVCFISLFSSATVYGNGTTPSTGNGTTPSSGSFPGSSDANTGYQPPNVEEAAGQKAKAKKEKADKKAKQEKKIEDDDNYQTAKEAADAIDTLLEKDDPTLEDVDTLDSHYVTVSKFVEDNEKKYKESSQLAELKQTLTSYDEKIGSVSEAAKNRAEAEGALEKAKTSTDLSDLSALTSYVYVEDGGFWGTGEIFPKIVNSIVQAIFFLVKAIYILVIIVLSTVFNAKVYGGLDKVVEFSAKLFHAFMADLGMAIVVMVLCVMAYQFLRYRRIGLSVFSFILVWLTALVLYSESDHTMDFGGDYEAKYNLSKVVKTVDTFGSELTSKAIANFDEVDGTVNNQVGDTSEKSVNAVREAIFDTLVYRPFLALNFDMAKVKKGDKGEGTEEMAYKLFVTNGTNDDVKKFAENDAEDYQRLFWTAIGTKFMVAFAALFKAVVIGFALILLGLMSLVFKNLTLILIVFSVILALIAMAPGLGHIIVNAGKKMLQFALLGSLGLFFIRGFLFVNTLIEAAADSLSDAYHWSAIIQGLIWWVIYLFRGALGSLFTRGTLSALELKDRAQQGLSYVSNRELYHPFQRDRLAFDGVSSEDYVSQGPGVEPLYPGHNDLLATEQRRPSRFRTLSRAGKNGLVRAYDRLRYGAGESPEKAYAQYKRADFRQKVADNIGATKDQLFSAMRFERARAGYHDLAGETSSPVQQRYEERQRRQMERRERRQERDEQANEWTRYRNSQDGQSKIQEQQQVFSNRRSAERHVKREFDKERFMERTGNVSPLFKNQKERSHVSEDGENASASAVKEELFNQRR
ncbi:hypothetical protein AB3331_09465 [Streptococcus sp. H49]|uniref:hypothetical protein n=1 Tax=Streptococcus huangxiaojuni TaxID=3237239 RepID=UPI0034A307EA